MLWILLGVVALLVVALVFLYNRLVTLRNRVENAWAQVDVQLRRRYDLIPNLVETVKGYAQHEREVFENVTRARAAAAAATGSPAQQAAAEGPFVAALRQLFAVAENYPQLRANENFLALQAELGNTEDRLQTARRFYNANVRDYNRRVQSFPSNTIANSFHFQQAEFFEVPDAVREAGPPQVNFTQEGPGVSFGSPGTPASERSTTPEGTQTPAPPPPPGTGG
jgi:LemA protein